MENENRQENGGGMKCTMCGGSGFMHKNMCCGHGFGHRHFVLRVILGAAILAFVFSMGVKLGELKAVFGGGSYGNFSKFRMMGGLNEYVPTMMGRYYYDQSAPQQSTPTTPKQ